MTTPSAPSSNDTAQTINLFNDAFQRRDVDALAVLVHDDCVMVSTQPAPDGTEFVGKNACVAFWAELMAGESTTFEVEHVFADGEWATVRWRYRFGPTAGESVLGVNVTRVSAGRVVEQLGYTKTPGGLPLPTLGTVVVAGHVAVEPAERGAYLEGCRDVVGLARVAPGCLDFTIGPDLLDDGRINVHECWESREAVEAFRGSGPDCEQLAALRFASVFEHDIAGTRPLLTLGRHR